MERELVCVRVATATEIQSSLSGTTQNKLLEEQNRKFCGKQSSVAHETEAIFMVSGTRDNLPRQGDYNFFGVVCWNLTNPDVFSSKKKETTPEPEIQKKSSQDISTIMWISVTAALILVLITGLINCLRKCSDPVDTKLMEVAEIFTPTGVDTKGTMTASRARELVSLEQVLSQGRYATVWKGRFKEQLVTLKVYPEAARLSWQKECAIYELLSGEHPNISKIIHKEIIGGTDEPLWLVMEHCENGSLREYLLKKVLSWREAIFLASGFTRGVAFLHSESFADGRAKVAVIHRDLKSTNILVRKDGTSVISHFGLALSLGCTEDGREKMQVGTFRYMSPEELLTTVDLDSTETFKQMDIYSMALVLWEIVSRCAVADHSPSSYRLPFSEMVGTDATVGDMVEVVALQQYRPQFPRTNYEGLKAFCQTVQESWDPDAEARLTAVCTLVRLNELMTMVHARDEDCSEPAMSRRAQFCS
ncbi:LOW QUALITY PROTEIN: TGF-beta receptor type-2-like [Stylophora pistillata]|uniref:LOW QUALITY PROTEIN: TGF-beta receptor type-2-like n=1 Tax=Stylophora pistillata TaxID=50429 RepID=UPI000C0504FF|nr:LOW QUALITY PROTEIN: TGF-beta receptor type-2-like [Stylophora pistillata]